MTLPAQTDAGVGLAAATDVAKIFSDLTSAVGPWPWGK